MLVDHRRSYINYVKIALLFVVMLASSQEVLAKDTLASVLEQVVQQKLTVVEYREVKHIVYLQDPVETSGRIFIAGEKFVLEQKSPKRQLLAADKHRFRLYIPDRQVHYSKMLTSPQVQKSMQLFKPLMSGDQKALEVVFDTQFSVMGDARWLLTLTPKDTKGAKISYIRIQGEKAQPAHSAVIKMLNGNTSEWFFTLVPASKDQQDMMEKLLAESQG